VARAEVPGLDLDALASDVARATPASTRPAAAPTEGPARPAAAASPALAASAIAGVVSRLNKNWNPNCGVEGGDSVVVRVRLTLTPEGGLARQPELPDGQNPSGSSLADVAAARALRAINAAAPFSELPPESYSEWRSFVARFNAKTACAGR
jgi:outer membrane biosynthesis protein TonB